MWLFSNKSSDGPTAVSSLGVVLGVGGDDSLSHYTLDSNIYEEVLLGPHNLRWSRQSATHRKTGEFATVFSCHFPQSRPHESVMDTLSQAVKRMKTLRQPNILNWVAGTETNKMLKSASTTNFHIVTERVVSLSDYLRDQSDKGNFTYLASWGIYQVTRALGFLNDDCQLSHNAVCLSSVYVNRSGEWKLGRFDFVTPVGETDRQIQTPYCPPKGCCADAWGLACLIWEVFNTAKLRDATQLSSKESLDRLPKPLHAAYRRLLSTRTTPSLGVSKKSSPFLAFLKTNFFTNNYISTLLFLEEIQLKEKQEKSEFLADLGRRAVGLFPDDICRYKILPHLVTSLQFGSAGVEALVPVLELAHLLSPADFDVVVLPVLVRLFAARDRSTRVRLLEQLPRFVQKLPRGVIEGQVFGPVSEGFSDANPLVREATVRAMVHLAPHLPAKILNDALLRHLTNLQFKDEQGGIRANATICLAKLAHSLEPKVRRGVLLNAFLRATRDPFVPSRQASVTALAASQGFYSSQELASKVLPCLSFLTVDAEKEIRETTLRALRGLLDRLEQASDDPGISEPDLTVTGAGSPVAVTERLTSAGTSLGNWALGALSSISSRLISSATTSSTTAAAAKAEPKAAPADPPVSVNSKANTDRSSVRTKRRDNEEEDWNSDIFDYCDIKDGSHTGEEPSTISSAVSPRLPTSRGVDVPQKVASKPSSFAHHSPQPPSDDKHHDWLDEWETDEGAEGPLPSTSQTRSSLTPPPQQNHQRGQLMELQKDPGISRRDDTRRIGSASPHHRLGGLSSEDSTSRPQTAKRGLGWEQQNPIGSGGGGWDTDADFFNELLSNSTTKVSTTVKSTSQSPPTAKQQQQPKSGPIMTSVKLPKEAAAVKADDWGDDW